MKTKEKALKQLSHIAGALWWASSNGVFRQVIRPSQTPPPHSPSALGHLHLPDRIACLQHSAAANTEPGLTTKPCRSPPISFAFSVNSATLKTNTASQSSKAPPRSPQAGERHGAEKHWTGGRCWKSKALLQTASPSGQPGAQMPSQGPGLTLRKWKAESEWRQWSYSLCSFWQTWVCACGSGFSGLWQTACKQRVLAEAASGRPLHTTQRHLLRGGPPPIRVPDPDAFFVEKEKKKKRKDHT